MTAKILDGKALAKKLEADIAGRVAEFRERTGAAPCLAAVLVGEDPASQVERGAVARTEESALPIRAQTAAATRFEMRGGRAAQVGADADADEDLGLARAGFVFGITPLGFGPGGLGLGGWRRNGWFIGRLRRRRWRRLCNTAACEAGCQALIGFFQVIGDALFEQPRAVAGGLELLELGLGAGVLPCSKIGFSTGEDRL